MEIVAFLSLLCQYNLFADDLELVENGHYQILSSGDLLIAGVNTRDEGKYTCLRANEAGTVKGDAWLSILGKWFGLILQ